MGQEISRLKALLQLANTFETCSMAAHLLSGREEILLSIL